MTNAQPTNEDHQTPTNAQIEAWVDALFEPISLKCM